MTIPDILAAAADVIETRGWHQGGYVPDNSDPKTAPVCAFGAINVAAGLQPNGHPKSRLDIACSDRANSARLRFRDYIGDYIPTWNDARGRTAEQVIGALRAAAEQAGRPA